MIIFMIQQLNFGTSYDATLLAAKERGAFDMMRAFVFSLYLSSTGSSDDGDLLSTDGMQNMTRDRVAQHMQLSIHVEKPHPTMPAITVGEVGGPHLEFVELVAGVLKQTGEVLKSSGYPSLGAFLWESLKEAKRVGSDGRADVDVVVKRLVQAFPAFCDVSEDGQRAFMSDLLVFSLLVLIRAHCLQRSTCYGKLCSSP